MIVVRSEFTAMLVWFSLTFVGHAQVAGEESQQGIEAILDKAVKAHGGEDNMRKIGSSMTKSVGKVYRDDESASFSLILYFNTVEEARSEFTFEIADKKYNQTEIVNKDGVWVIGLDGQVVKQNGAELKDTKEEMYVRLLSTHLYMLKEKAIETANVGELRIREKKAEGIRVSAKGHRDLTFFFDQDTGLLVKMEDCVVIEGKRLKREAFLSKYREVDGVQFAARLEVLIDGKKHLEIERTEIKNNLKMDPKLFQCP